MFTPECFSIAALIIMRAQRDAASHTSRPVIIGLPISRPWRGSDAASDPAFRGHRRGSWLDRNLEPEMESPKTRLLRLLVERDPARPEFISEFRESLRPILRRAEFPGDGGFDLWQDVFVQPKLPWGRFLQSALLHVAAVALIWTLSLSWIRQQRILVHAAFDPSSLVTYTPEEYLPALDTGAGNLYAGRISASARHGRIGSAERAKGRPRLREATDPFGSSGSRQSVPNHRRAARSQARPRCRLAQHRCHGSHRSGGSAGCDASPVEPHSCAGDAGRGARAGRGVCAGPCGSGGYEVGCDCAASERGVSSNARLGWARDCGRGTASGVSAIDQGTRWAHEHWPE